MLKLKAAFAKKIPAETEYSSQSYHCEIECEIPDGLTKQQLDDKVHGVFDFVRQSVESELNGTRQTSAQSSVPAANSRIVPLQRSGSSQQPVAQAPASSYQQPNRYSGKAAHQDTPASAKQLNFLLSLAKRSGWSVDRILQDCGLATLDEMPRRTCSQLIERLQAA